ncbi:hypothetical protein C8J56DRAFT_896680 [Mycena floridula]|nr:hypothetical protein C8J56DRAFT_896680 [Mycena floridula]
MFSIHRRRRWIIVKINEERKKREKTYPYLKRRLISGVLQETYLRLEQTLSAQRGSEQNVRQTALSEIPAKETRFPYLIEMVQVPERESGRTIWIPVLVSANLVALHVILQRFSVETNMNHCHWQTSVSFGFRPATEGLSVHHGIGDFSLTVRYPAVNHKNKEFVKSEQCASKPVHCALSFGKAVARSNTTTCVHLTRHHERRGTKRDGRALSGKKRASSVHKTDPRSSPSSTLVLGLARFLAAPAPIGENKVTKHHTGFDNTDLSSTFSSLATLNVGSDVGNKRDKMKEMTPPNGKPDLLQRPVEIVFDQFWSTDDMSPKIFCRQVDWSRYPFLVLIPAPNASAHHNSAQLLCSRYLKNPCVFSHETMPAAFGALWRDTEKWRLQMDHNTYLKCLLKNLLWKIRLQRDMGIHGDTHPNISALDISAFDISACQHPTSPRNARNTQPPPPPPQFQRSPHQKISGMGVALQRGAG